MAPKPAPTREYTYLVGRVPITALLTEEQATRYGATPVEPDEPVATEDVTDKARRPRKRA